MAETSKIEWTDATWNPITGCSLVSEGCRHCYAARLAATRLRDHQSRAGLARLNASGDAKFTGEVRFNAQWLDQPLRWRRPRRIFVCAHGDLFHESVPDHWVDWVFAVMGLCFVLDRAHTFQVLTKRPERAARYLSDEATLGRVQRAMKWQVPGFQGEHAAPRWPLPNVWLGTSVEDQAHADARIPRLLASPAAVRFVSAEPLLGPIDLTCIRQNGIGRETDALRGLRGQTPWGETTPRLDWVIVGGESGPGARPMHPDWARSLRDQCESARVAFFLKQMARKTPIPPDLMVRQMPQGAR